MQDMNNTPNQHQGSAPSNEWQDLLETPEVMSSSGSPSSRDIPAPADYPWDEESSSVPSSSSSSHPSHDVTTTYKSYIQGAHVAPRLNFTVHIKATCDGGPKGTPHTFSNIRVESLEPDPCELVKVGLEDKIYKVAIVKVNVSAYEDPIYDAATETTAQKILVSWEGKIWEHDHPDNPFPYDPNGRDIQNNSMDAHIGERWATISCGK